MAEPSGLASQRGSAAAKLPLAWRPPMKRATRNGPVRVTSSASAKTGLPSALSIATKKSGPAWETQFRIQEALCAGANTAERQN